MRIKIFIAGFLLCTFLNIIAMFLVWSLQDTGETHKTILIFSIYIWFVEFLMHLLIYSLYFLMVRTLIINLTSLWGLVLAMFIVAACFIALTAFLEWRSSQDQYPLFGNYLNKGAYFLMDVRIVAVVLSIIGVVKFNRTRSPSHPS